MVLSFNALVEGYKGTKKYEIKKEEDFKQFFNTLKIFINDAENNEIIDIRLFDINGKLEIEYNELNVVKNDPTNIPTKTKKPKKQKVSHSKQPKKPKRLTFEENYNSVVSYLGKNKGWVTTQDLNENSGVARSTLFKLLRKCRAESKLKYRMVDEKFEYKK